MENLILENEEHILAKADIKFVKTKFSRIVTLIYILLVTASLIVGLVVGTYSYHSDGGETIYGQSYPAHDDVNIGWYAVDFYDKGEGWEEIYIYGDRHTYWGSHEDTYIENVILVGVLYVVLYVVPIVFFAILKRSCKATALTITDSQVYGSYNKFLFKKSLKMPIDKVDNLTTISGLMDKFRSGVTLGVCSASGIIRIHFVQNVDEVIGAAIGRIEEIKEKKTRAVAQSVVVAAESSVSEKLKELALMKEQALITEEEYNKKRDEILAKM